jgi:hypothetical protein
MSVTPVASGPVVSGNPVPARSRWFWPPYPVTFVAIGSILVVALFANFPAVEVTRPRLDGNGKYGPHFELISEYQHGWPVRYSRRDSFKVLAEPMGILYSERASPWTPWSDSLDFSSSALLVNAFAWLAILLSGAVLVQFWRSRRRAIWQLRLVDLLGIVTAIAAMIAWYTQQRTTRRDERNLAIAAHGVAVSLTDDLGAATPAWLPEKWRQRYLQEFGRVQYFSGHEGTASHFPHLLVLQSPNAGPEFGELLRRMPQLEALDMFMGGFHQDDEHLSFTAMREMPPMPNLRGVNLYDTNVTDADLVWLSKCPRLECIDLTGVKISDAGLEHLTGLTRLRVLSVAGDGITDRGCQLLARISSLEDLSLDSFHVTDAGLAELPRLKRLKRLQIEAAISDRAIARLRKEMPACEISPTIITAR